MSDEGRVLAWRGGRHARPEPTPASAENDRRYAQLVQDVRGRGKLHWVYRSDQPITPDWWQCARFVRGITVEEVAGELECSVEHVVAVEAGTEQPTYDEVCRYAALTDFPLVFFWQAPSTLFADPTAFNSLDYHASLPSFVCDPCERETGEEVEAVYRCAECGDDLCEGCARLCDDDRNLCERCWRKAIGQKAAQTRRRRHAEVREVR